MCSVIVVSQQLLDDTDELLLDTVRAFVDVHGGIAESVGGVELVRGVGRKFYVCIHCEGYPPPLPGAPADA